MYSPVQETKILNKNILFFEILHFHDKFVGKCTYLPSGKLRGNRRRKIFSPANSRRKYGETTPFPRCDFFGYFRRDLAAISPRVFLPFPQCGFRGYFCGDFTVVFLTFFAMRFQGVIPRLFYREFSHFFRSAVLRGYFRGDFTVVFRTFFVVRFQWVMPRLFRREFSYFFHGAVLGEYFRSDFTASFCTFFAVRFQGGITAAISPRVFALFSQCELRGAFSQRYRREFSHLSRGATLGVHFRSDFAASFHTFFAVRLQGCIFAAISPRLLSPFSRCDFRGYFSRDFAAIFRNYLAVQVQGYIFAAISPRVFAPFSRCNITTVNMHVLKSTRNARMFFIICVK